MFFPAPRRNFRPQFDSDLGGTDDLFSKYAAVKQNVMYAKWSRNLKTTDSKYDLPMDLSNGTILSLLFLLFV